MWLFLLPMLVAQVPVDRAVLDAEQARAAGVPALTRFAQSRDPKAQRLAARALGRLEDTAQRVTLVPLLTSPNAGVRRSAAGAMAQLRVAHDYTALLRTERDPAVRAALFEAAGRARGADVQTEAMLTNALRAPNLIAATGAARGLESLLRLGGDSIRLQPATLAVIEGAFLANRDASLRQLLLLTLNRARYSTPALVAAATRDPHPEVRRLVARQSAAALANDPSPMVRYEALRFAATCNDAHGFLADVDEQVMLGAIEATGRREGCDRTRLAPLVTTGSTWRIRSLALVWAAMDDAERLRAIRTMAADTTWQVRVAVATAARLAKDSATVATLVRDSNPNVVIAAMTRAEDAVRNLRSEHAGLALASANLLMNQKTDLRPHQQRVVGAYLRLANDGTMTTRDPRVAILKLLGTLPDTSTNALLRDALNDRDPAIAAEAARILTLRTGTAVAAGTTVLPIPPMPPASYIRGLLGASARIRMRGLGTMTVDLLTSEAPVTVGVFAQLAESGQYNGLTFHRIVPNFVIQGGSPGADEYDGRTREFLRDEVGFARNARGTIGISTRGRDTGDGQIYFNLVDNVRLDRDYTVMATMRSGLDVMDRILEGAVIERIDIIRRPVSKRR
jgi:cyclophilin family peptidyl-prolyl cis-trans isomerase/HEAT repeat protein